MKKNIFNFLSYAISSLIGFILKLLAKVKLKIRKVSRTFASCKSQIKYEGKKVKFEMITTKFCTTSQLVEKFAGKDDILVQAAGDPEESDLISGDDDIVAFIKEAPAGTVFVNQINTGVELCVKQAEEERDNEEVTTNANSK